LQPSETKIYLTDFAEKNTEIHKQNHIAEVQKEKDQ